MAETFYMSFRPILLFSQLCGLMPLRGILGKNPENLRFTWLNPMHLYGIGVSSVAFFFDAAFTEKNIEKGFSIDGFASTVFYTVCLLTTGLFLRVGKKLPEIGKDFLLIEKSMSEYEPPNWLALKIKLFLIIFILLATIEHGTMIILHFQAALEVARNSTSDFGETFYVMHFPSVSTIIPYSGLLTIILTWANAICTFNWNFLDFFLIGMSLELVAKFDQITEKLSDLNCDNKSYEFWEKMRCDYGRITILTKKLDKILSGIIVTSFFSNLYHLSLQLLRSLRISGTYFHKVYFYFSLSYLILRLLTTLFCLASVNEAGKKPKDILFSLESNWTSSLRLLQQILNDDIQFTGSGTFTITRSFVFSVIGTIITYQAVLLQLDSLSFVDATLHGQEQNK